MFGAKNKSVRFMLPPNTSTPSSSMSLTNLSWVTRCAVASLVFGLASFQGTSSLRAQDEADQTPVADVEDENPDDDLIRGIDEDRTTKVVNGRFELPPMVAASIATDQIGNGRTPPGFREQNVTPLRSLPEAASDRGEIWNWSVSNWAAANTFSMPRFFEDRMLERHGHERFGCWQPLASGARFFATIPMLPYLSAIKDPCECEYTLGYYRPGSCAPALVQRPPYDRRAMVAESIAVATGMLALP